MSFLFGSSTNSEQTPAYTGLQVQTSAYGLAVQLCYGQARIVGNLIWYGDFQAIAQSQSMGKGFGGGETSSYRYQASMMFGLCEGLIASVLKVWISKDIQDIEDTAFAVFLGSIPQSAWGFLASTHPLESLNYQGLAYVAVANYDLGNSASTPSFSFEVAGLLQNVSGQVDADPADVIEDLLTNTHYSGIFPAARLGDLTDYSDYCRAAGLLISPVFSDATEVGQSIADIVELTNSAIVVSEGKLRIVPYGDEPLSGNGSTYTPDLTALYDLTIDDFLPEADEEPITISRARPSDCCNQVTLEYKNRENAYNTETTTPAVDQASVELYGLRPEDSTQAHMFCDPDAAHLAGQLRLQRFAVRLRYRFKLGWRYILLDPMDLVSLTYAPLALDKKLVRIVEISEDEEGKLSMTAEEVLPGAGTAEAYPYEEASGYGSSEDVDPGSVNDPLIWEPPAKLVTDPQIWVAVSGGAHWGGCNVWASTDGSSYQKVGTIKARAKHGTLSATLPAGAADPDTVNTLSVDLSAALGTLLSATQGEADLYATLCYVDGEYVSFATATLTDLYKYNLTYLRRGANSSTNGIHASGSKFARLDGAIFKYTYTQVMVGTTVYLKFTSFNSLGGREQSLADVTAYSIALSGTSVPAGYTYDPDYTPVYDDSSRGA